MASLSAYSVTEPLGLTLGVNAHSLKKDLLLNDFLFDTKQLKQNRRQNW